MVGDSSFSGFAEQQLQIWFPLLGEKTGLQNTKGFYQIYTTLTRVEKSGPIS